MNSRGLLHMDKERLDDQLEPIHSSSVPIQDVGWKTSREQWAIVTDGERELGRSVLAAQPDDDDDEYLLHLVVWPRLMCSVCISESQRTLREL